MPGSGKDGKLPIPIKTARLNLRPLRVEDWDDWIDFIKDEDSYLYLNYDAPNDERARMWFEDLMDLRFTRPKRYLCLGIELVEEAKLIGCITLSFNDPEEHQQGCFDIILHPAYRRRGYGSEALMGLIRFVFECIGMHDIRKRVDIRNVAGCRMVEKAGMKLEGTFHEERRIKGEWISSAYYAMIRRWWRNERNPELKPF